MNKNIIESENVDAASLAQLRLNYERKQAEQRKNDFDYAETQLYLSQQQNLEDCYLIQEKIAEWMDGIKAKKPEKFKDDPNYKMFSNFINAIFRIENYTRNIETSNKKAIVEYLEQKRETEKYLSSLPKPVIS